MDSLNEIKWRVLLQKVRTGECTPFLGAGVNGGQLPLGGEVSRDWAARFNYPLRQPASLDAVAQFVAVEGHDSLFPKTQFIEDLHVALARAGAEQLDRFVRDADKPLGMLARLPLPIYITTNYDDLMVRALLAQGKKPRREFCRWNPELRELRLPQYPELLAPGSDFVPDAQNPVVFHLHGMDTVPKSLVLTEDDYLEFLVSLGRGGILPERIQGVMASTSLLFMGYALADINFRVIFRTLREVESGLRTLSVSVQLLPVDLSPDSSDKVKQYLSNYFEKLKVDVFWTSADEFARQLNARWAAAAAGSGAAP